MSPKSQQIIPFQLKLNRNYKHVNKNPLYSALRNENISIYFRREGERIEDSVNVLLAGGTGFVGSNLARRLVREGHQVHILLRPGSEYKHDISLNVTYVGTDFERTDIVLPGNPDVIINCIGIIREFPSRGITFENIHFKLVEYLVKLAKIHNINRFIQISALGTGPTANTEYFRTKYMAEELLLSSNLHTTIFKPSVIFGPGDDFINMIAGYIRRFSIMPVIGDGNYRLQPVCIEDLCGVIMKAINDDFSFEKRFDIAGPDILTFNELVDIVATAVGKNAKKLHQPVFVMRTLAALFDRFRWFPVTREQIAMLFMENFTDDNQLFDRYKITRTSLADGIRDYL